MNIYLHNKEQRLLSKCHSPRAEAQRERKGNKLVGWIVTAIVEETSPVLLILGGRISATQQRSISSSLLPNPPYSSTQIALGSYNFTRQLLGEQITEEEYLQVRLSYEAEARNET